MTELMVVLPAPVTVSGRVAPVMPPVATVSVPASDPRVAPPAPSTMAPDQVLALARLRMAPVAADPGADEAGDRLGDDEAACRRSRSRRRWPPWSRAAVVPRAPFDWTRITPVVTVVPPLYVFAPDSVSVPVPVFVRATVPEPLASVPGERRRGVAREAARQGHGARGAAGDRGAGHARDRADRVGEAVEVERGAATTRSGPSSRPPRWRCPGAACPRSPRWRPVYVLATESSSVPAPAFVRPPTTGDGVGRLRGVARAIDGEGEAAVVDGPAQGQRAGVGGDLARRGQGDRARPGVGVGEVVQRAGARAWRRCPRGWRSARR